MNRFSAVDGFVEITESLAGTIKFVANEPSVGLFYIQQHTKNAVPNVVNLRDHVVEKSHEVTLHTDDSEDSVTMVRSMKECSFPIADEMIEDIKSSLTLMSAKRPKRGLIRGSGSIFQMRRANTWGPTSCGPGFDDAQFDGGNYFSTVIKSARQKASNFKWSQLDSKEQMGTEPQKLPLHPAPPLSVASASFCSVPDIEADDLPVSSEMADEVNEEEKGEETEDDIDLQHHRLSFLSGNYEDFKADRAAKFVQWLRGSKGRNG